MSEKDDNKHITKISATESNKADDKKPTNTSPADAPKVENTKEAQPVDSATTEAKTEKTENAPKTAETSNSQVDANTEKSAAKSEKTAKPAKKIEVSAPAKDEKTAKTDKKTKKAAKTDDKGRRPLHEYFIIFRPFVAFSRYLHDSWIELCQVRWPSRKMTWKLTLAVLIYCALFMVFIVVLDMIFTFLFNKLLGQ